MTGALTLLEDIGKSHERMVDLAGKLDWNGVAKEWSEMTPKLMALKKLPLAQLSAGERIEASEQLAKLIAFEEQISARITPWMEQVRPLLESFRKYPLKPVNGENR